jgi:hypothetical protein
MVLAGPHPAIDSNDPGAAGFTGSLIVAEFDSLSAAQAWADADPYIAAGVYANVSSSRSSKSCRNSLWRGFIPDGLRSNPKPSMRCA